MTSSFLKDEPQEVRICIKTKDGMRYEYRFVQSDHGKKIDLDLKYNVDTDQGHYDGWGPVIRSQDRTLTLILKH